MEFLQVLLTAILVAAAITLILKKADVRLTFLALGVIGLAAATLVTGTSVQGSSTTGSMILDIFDVIRAKFISTIQGTGIRLMMIGGYVMLMNHVKAADVLALTAAKTLKGIKNPYIVLGCVYVIGVVLKVFITSQVALGLLMVATMFPVMTRLGISRMSATIVCICLGGMDIGPNDSTGIFIAEVLGCTPMEWFVNYEIIVAPIIAVCTGIFLAFYCNRLDKKEYGGLVLPEQADAERKISDLDIPAFYGLFPMIPLTLVVVFSFVDGVKMDVITAHIISFFLFYIVDFIVKKDYKRIVENLRQTWIWMGNYFNMIIVLISVASVFAEALKKLGGIDVLAGMLANMQGASLIVCIALCAVGIVTALLTGSSNAPWYAFAELGISVAGTIGCAPGFILVPMHLTGGLCRCFSPFTGAVIGVTGMAEMDTMEVCKRAAAPMIFASIVCVIASALVFGM